MYLVLDEDDNIVSCVAVGDRPANGIVREVEVIPTDITTRIFDYKYTNGQFILKDYVESQTLERVKQIKIDWLRNMCSKLIEDGIDFNGEHYALTYADQINLSNLSTTATIAPDTPLFYHADGKLCREYSREEILQLTAVGISWISYHTTYNNFAREYISHLTDENEVKLFKYGMAFPPEYQTKFEKIVMNFPVAFHEEIDDNTDYDAILHPYNHPQTIFC